MPEAAKTKRPRRRKPTVRVVEFLTVSDMAEALGVCRDTVYRYIAADVIKAVRADTPGGKSRLKIPREFALRFLEGSAGHVPMPKPRGPRIPSEDPRQRRLF